MSEQELRDFEARLTRGLQLAEKRMLHEKALHGECVIMQYADGRIRRVPANQVIAENAIFQ